MITWLITTLLFFLPYVVLPIGMSPFETPKVLLVELIIITFLAISIQSISKQQIRDWVRAMWEKNKLLVIVSVGFFLWVIISLLFHFSPTAFLGSAFRLQGIFLYILLFCLFLFSIFYSFRPLPLKILIILFGMEVLAAYFIGGRVDGRMIGTLGEPNALAAFFIFLWPWIVFHKEITKSRYKLFLQLIFILVTGLLIYFTGSRSGLLAFVLQLILVGVAQKIALKQAVIVGTILFLGSLALPFLDRPTIYESRTEVWKIAALSGFSSPVIGSGIGNIQESLSLTTAQITTNLRFVTVDSSHNIFLDFWVQGGLLGLSLLLGFIFYGVRNQVKQGDKKSLLILYGLIICMSFNPVSVITLVQFWYLLGHGKTQMENIT